MFHRSRDERHDTPHPHSHAHTHTQTHNISSQLSKNETLLQWWSKRLFVALRAFSESCFSSFDRNASGCWPWVSAGATLSCHKATLSLLPGCCRFIAGLQSDTHPLASHRHFWSKFRVVEFAIHFTCMFWPVRGGGRTWREPTLAQGEHTKSTQKK